MPEFLSFPGGSAGKESAYNAGDPSLIPGSGRSSGEGNSYPLQYSWASRVIQTVKESTCKAGGLGSVPGLGRSPGGTATYISILAWRIPLDRVAWWAIVHGGCKQSDMTEQLSKAQCLHQFSSVQSLSRVRLFATP